jgi:hypothetical protein
MGSHFNIANASCMLLDRVSEISIRNCVVSPKILLIQFQDQGFNYRLMDNTFPRGRGFP